MEGKSSIRRGSLTRSKDSDIMSCLMKSLNTQRQLNILCDVVLVVQREEFPAHKGILAANSNYFMAMFTTNMVEKKQTRVTIKQIVPSAVGAILEFMYTGNLQISESNVRDILEGSNFLLVSSIKDECCKFLESILKVDNCLTIISIADEFYCEELHQKATFFLNREFLHVVKQDDFMKLAVEDVTELFSSDEICIEDEFELFEALVNWVAYDLTGRRRFLSVLMPLVRLHFVQPGLIEDSIWYKDIAKELNGQGPWMNQSSIKPRKSYSNVPVILVAGGVDKFRILETVTCYIPSVNKWCALANMNVPRWNLNIISTGTTGILAIGGLQDVSTIQQELPYMEEYDIKANQWRTVTTPKLPFPVDSNSYRTVRLGNEVLFIKDRAEDDQEPSVVCLQDVHGKRSYVSMAPLPVRRSGYCCVATSDEVFVIGGSSQSIGHHAPLGDTTMQRYNRLTDKWTIDSPMTQQRCHACATELDGKIYVIGGCHGSRPLASGEVYDPKTRQWTTIAPLSTPRIRAGITVHDGKLWVLGGMDGPRGVVLDSTECYDPLTDTWTTCLSMPEKRRDFMCCKTEIAYRTVAEIMEK